MGGTRGSGIVSSAAEVLGITVMRWMKGVGGVCEMCMCLALGGVGGDGDEWIRGLGLGFTNPVGTWGVLHVCLCLGCGGVDGISGERINLKRWGGFMSVSLESLCRWQV